jgi:purine-binding chemotaxis protein CheW
VASVPHLVFSLSSGLYALPAAVVREIVWLPELTPVEDTAEYVVGVLNLRGHVVPVIDVQLRFGRSPQLYRLEDNVILVARGDRTIGVIVNAVHDVRDFPEEAIEPAPEDAPWQPGRFLAGFARFDEQVIALLDVERLLNGNAVPGYESTEPGVAWRPAERSFCPEATLEERTVFQDRARTLSQPMEAHDYAGLRPLAVTRLGAELYGFPLEVVREFAAVGSVTRVPCCPPHIIGQMNLRGDILTLVDVRSALQVQSGAATARETVVVQSGDMLVGINVDQVLDVLHLRPAEIAGIPSVLETAGGHYLEGTAPYGSQLFGILDLPKLLTGANLIVNEEP